MKRTILILLIILSCYDRSNAQNPDLLIKKWDLTYFSAIDKIESSLAMLLADTTTFNQFEKSKKMMMEDFYYQFFANGSMEYSDIENAELVIRKAYWKLENDTLIITELARPLERKAKILQLSENSMEWSLIIEGSALPGSKLIFKKIE